MVAGWLTTLAALVATLLGEPTDENAPAAATVEAEWSFDPSRCNTEHNVEVASPRRWIRHRVRPRETISAIAFRHGVAPWEVRGWNGLTEDTERVRRGTRLRVKAARLPPPLEKLEVELQEGDSWGSVARSYGTTPGDLRSYNFPHRGKMAPGNVLEVFADPVLRDWVAGASEDDLVPRGGVGIGPPDMGSLQSGVQIPEGEGYRLRFPRSAYGTTHAVTELLTALRAFRRDSDWSGTLAIGAMSALRGGQIGHHKSHQTGRDVDIRLPRRDGVSRYAELRPRRVDWNAAWALVVALSKVDTQVVFLDYKRQKYLHHAARELGATDEMLEALLQYPRGRHARLGLVRHYPGHEKHFHIRFRCGPCELACVAASLSRAPGSEVSSEAGAERSK